jgi:protein SCO1/2
MTMRIMTLLLLFAMPSAAWAGLSRVELQTVSVSPPPAAKLDLALSAPDASGASRSVAAILQGHPGFVNFADYTCHTLCGTDLMLLADGIRRAGLRPADFRIIVMGLDPKDHAQAALTMERKEIPPILRPVTAFLLPNQATIIRATKALGFHYVYDPDTDQFAHPAVVYAVAADGSLRGILSPLALTAGDLRQVLEKAQPQDLGLYQRIRSLCYGYDPATGRYTPRITFLLKAAAMATMLLLVAMLGFFSRRRRQGS